eukprot:9997399-Alexandrium_andersonii.AAC.1
MSDAQSNARTPLSLGSEVFLTSHVRAGMLRAIASPKRHNGGNFESHATECLVRSLQRNLQEHGARTVAARMNNISGK